jgi:hypothetical protein
MKQRDKLEGPMSADDGPVALKCWGCSGEGAGRVEIIGCNKCQGTGAIFWVGGRTFPYTPEGEKRAKDALKVYG